MTVTTLIIKIKKANSNLMTLMTWSIISKIIQLVKQMLKKIDELNKTKKVETKDKWLIDVQKTLTKIV